MAISESLVYVLDERDCLASVNAAAWDRAARAAGAPALSAASAMGTSLWSQIGDATTAELYRLLLRRVRGGHAIDVSFDGSGPGVRREMRLHMRSLPHDHVECTSTVVREQRSDAPDGNPRGLQPPKQLTVCSWCGRMRVGNAWREVDEAVAAERVFLDVVPTVITHGACPDCAHQLTNDIQRNN